MKNVVNAKFSGGLLQKLFSQRIRKLYNVFNLHMQIMLHMTWDVGVRCYERIYATRTLGSGNLYRRWGGFTRSEKPLNKIRFNF